MKMTDLADWTPIRLHWEQGYPMLDWCYLGEVRFVEAFFDETIERRLRQPFNLLFRHQTPLSVLEELQTVTPGLPPSGFIFHMSRCGSTLVAQMLAALPRTIVIAEAGPIDTLLRSHWRDPNITDEQRITWLRGLLSVYARPRQGEQYFFVKLDSWHTLELPLLQRAFPGVPWLFLYRDPVQVMVSHQRQRGAQMVPGMLPPQWLGLDWDGMSQFDLDEYCARVLARICQAALHYRNQDALLINYQQLPGAVLDTIGAHFRLAFSAEDQVQMQRVTQVDVKNPSMPFVSDTAAKVRAVTPPLQQLAAQWLQPLYTALEAERRATASMLHLTAADRLA